MINLVKHHFQSDRDFVPLEESQNLQDLYKQMMEAEGIYLKGYDTHIKVRFKGQRPDGNHIFEMESIPESLGNSFTVHTTPSFHAEVEYELISQKDNLLLGKLKEKKQTFFVRQDPRNHKVLGNVLASNFLIAKTDIDFSKLTGVSSQVILTDIHRNLLKDYPQSKVVFLSSSVNSDEIELMQNYKKPLYLINTQMMESAPLKEVFDPKSSFEEDFLLEDKIAEYKRKKMGSFLYYPIFIQMNDLHFFAYLSLEYEKSPVPQAVFDLYKEVEATFQERIMDSNTHILDIKQNVLNISKTGVAIEVRDREIIKSLKIKPSMTIDINFKMQAPIRMALELRHMEEVNDFFIIGSRIVGVSGDKKAKDIYHSLIDFFR
ncbi:DUF1577 domain-containing protein [Leptospira idonii]|uniref:DUF1577 domain-containing protein n=1 Tax=Leptospira idonii TaxID=1193500 RepID=A0A4R9LTT1_9LEPT|nr:DUF1577 domain-containing protein [Leptospira idonii]TGN17145.1 DUF1577 domain-containing protein [Leptospira idonii]